MNTAVIYSFGHCRKSKDVCQNCSGSRDHRVTANPNSKKNARTRSLLFSKKNLIKNGSRSSELASTKVYRCTLLLGKKRTHPPTIWARSAIFKTVILEVNMVSETSPKFRSYLWNRFLKRNFTRENGAQQCKFDRAPEAV